MECSIRKIWLEISRLRVSKTWPSSNCIPLGNFSLVGQKQTEKRTLLTTPSWVNQDRSQKCNLAILISRLCFVAIVDSTAMKADVWTLITRQISLRRTLTIPKYPRSCHVGFRCHHYAPIPRTEESYWQIFNMVPSFQAARLTDK